MASSTSARRPSRASPVASPADRTAGTPLISVVIPSFNRERLLRQSLRSIEAQDLAPTKFEVIVVVDGSTDRSAAMLSNLATAFRLTPLAQPNAGAGAARNRGVAAAAARYCLFVDDDITLAPGALAAHLAAQQRLGGAVCVGPIDTVSSRRGFPAYYVGFWKRWLQRRERGTPLAFNECFSGNMSVPTEAFLALGGFDTSLRRDEDIELAYRLNLAGLPLVYVETATARQHFDKTTRECLGDATANGAAELELLARYPGMRDAFGVSRAVAKPGLYARLVWLVVRLPVPIMACSAVGVLSPRIPGVRRLFRTMHTYWYFRGARTSAHWDAFRREG